MSAARDAAAAVADTAVAVRSIVAEATTRSTVTGWVSCARADATGRDAITTQQTMQKRDNLFIVPAR
ncbi:MAG: hypothetical protein ACM3NQ_18195 [Bacteroidales bacterium]